MNRSYRIGYAFQNRVKKYLVKKGWNIITQPKSAFPDHLCWKLKSLMHKSYEVIFVECKVNKYLSRDEKEKATLLLKENKDIHI